jgi:8-oxo-dGTP pyrophosphatase MutT (NUDIX family)
MTGLEDQEDLPIPVAPWNITASRHVLKDRWISVRADDCRTSEGKEIAPFYVLEYPDWVQVVAIDTEDNVILVEQYRHGLGIISLELPAGAIESTDASPLIAGARELQEETGYGGPSWQCAGRLSPNPASHNNLCHVVVALNVSFQRAVIDDPTERVRVVRVPIRAAIDLAMSGGIVQAMHVASMFLGLGAAGKWRP